MSQRKKKGKGGRSSSSRTWLLLGLVSGGFRGFNSSVPRSSGSVVPFVQAWGTVKSRVRKSAIRDTVPVLRIADSS